MGISLDPTGILSLIAIIAGAQVSNAYGVGPRPTGIFTADPNHRRQPQPTGILTTNPSHRSKILQPTGIIAADPTGVFALDPSSNRHRRFGGRGLNPTEIITGPLDPTGTYRYDGKCKH